MPGKIPPDAKLVTDDNGKKIYVWKTAGQKNRISWLYRPVEQVKEQGVAEGHADQQRKVFKKNGEPVGEVGIDRESSPGNGQWYMKYYATGDDFSGYDSMEEAVADLKHLVNQFKAEGVAEGSPQSMGTALTNALSKVEPGSKLDKKIRHHNDMVRRFGPEAGTMTSAPDGYRIDKKGFIRLGQGVAEGNYSDEANPIRDDGNEPPDYAAMYENKLVEFAGGMGTGSVATAPGVGKGSNVGSLFGGSYSQKNSPFKKTKAKKESVIKR